MTSLPMSRTNLAILGACLAVGVAGYALVGKPGAGDQPMSQRQAALAEKVATDPQSLSPAELLSRLEQAVKDQPDAPEPHFFIGEMLRAQGRPEDALRAYQSALRRNSDYVPALVALSDVLVELSGGAVGITEYLRSLKFTPTSFTFLRCSGSILVNQSVASSYSYMV